MKIFTNTQFVKEIDKINMTIYNVSYVEVDSTWTETKTLTPYTRIYLITDGEASISHKGESIILRPGNIYILPPGTDFARVCNDEMKKFFFHLNVTNDNSYDILYAYDKCIVLENKEEEIKSVRKLFAQNDVCSALLMKSIVLSLISEAINQEGIELGEIKEYSPTVKKAISIIDKKAVASMRISDIANELHVSESRLQKDFKQETGIPMGRYINNCIMSRAHRLLKKSDLSVKDVSDMLGFCDQFYFSKRFSQYFGISPLAYKKKPL